MMVGAFSGAVTDLICPECGAAMVFKPVSRFGPFYGCVRFPVCRATHGAHPDGAPLGTPAGTEVKAARIAAHAAFDVLWKDGYLRRKACYARMARALGMTRHECHIGSFGIEECSRVVEWACKELQVLEASKHD